MDMDTTALTDSWSPTATPDDAAAGHHSPAGIRGGGGLGSLAARVGESLARGLVTCVFATVGTVLGAITGGLIGLATETGVVRGTCVGGITGALVSMEVVESSLAIWRSDEPAIWSVVYVVLDVIWSLLTGRLVREKVDPAVLSAVESQMSAVEAPVGHGDAADIFETGSTSGMPRAAINALPVMRFAERAASNVEASGELIACSVCLQEFEAGESARSLPVCRHTFHLPCIDGWLLRHASCPLCRRAV
ncbi:NEP1-interacting protein-like 1 [Dichanthelium oligosanthes]|uniref:NEP1-interacting protein-like 1 n=1 Tax=Dichanthelium oligosanthes TaxID=888268 RepID=A0A1E5WEC4_9POAL|nr:NEP1-interacting protein-like 1 [Dichanthelium oligosanthes]